jgi:tape measure domain-containing protein
MADSLDFQFNLFDKITGPVDAMVHSLDAMGRALNATQKAMGAVNAQAKKDFFTFDMATAMQAGVGAIGSMISKTTELGKHMLNSSAGAERLRTSFEAIAGKEGAKAVMKDIEGIAKNSAFDDDALMAAARPLVQAGMSGEDLKNALVTALESEAQRGGGISQVQGALDAMLKIRQTGSVNARTLTEFGVKAADVWGIVGKGFGVSAKQAEKMAETGKIGSQNLIAAMQQAMAAKTGGVLGGGAVAAADTMETKMRKLTELPDQFFKKMANTAAFDKIKAAIDRVLVALDPDGPNGAKINDFLVGTFETMASLIGAVIPTVEFLVDHFVGLSIALGVVAVAVGAVGAAWATVTIVSGITSLIALWPMLVAGASTAAAVFGALILPVIAVGAALYSIYYAIEQITAAVKELGGLSRVWDDLKEFVAGDGPAAAGEGVNANSPAWKKAAFEAKRAGRDAGLGFSNGLEEATSPDAGAALGQSAATGLQDSLEIRSPSRVFAKLGAHTAQGFAEGVQGGSSMTQGALGSMATAPRLGASGGNSFSVEINVTLGGQDKGEGETVARRLADLMPSMLEDAFTKLATESGGI